MKKTSCKIPGFTLIELLLYISLSAIILLAITFFMFTSLNSRIKTQAINQVEQQGLLATETITQSLRNATQINGPSSGSQSAQLSLDVIDSGDRPTIFDLSSNSIRFKEGSASAIELTHFPVIASDLTFKNLSSAHTPGSIRFEFTLTHTNPEGKNEYDYTKTFSASASLRQ